MPHAESTKPAPHEAIPYYSTYIDKVPSGDIRATLETQLEETRAFLNAIGEEKSRHRYAPGKWSLREVLSHINDTERLFVFRAFWFARRFDSPLPDFDQEIALAASSAHEVSWARHVAEFGAVRAATTHFFRNLPDAAGVSGAIGWSGNPFTVGGSWERDVAGHVAHHVGSLLGSAWPPDRLGHGSAAL